MTFQSAFRSDLMLLWTSFQASGPRTNDVNCQNGLEVLVNAELPPRNFRCRVVDSRKVEDIVFLEVYNEVST